jgi:hypothetical protein
MQPLYRSIILAVICVFSLIVTLNKCQRKKAKERWGPELERELNNVFYQQASRVTTDEILIQKYTDCCISKMKEVFPNGIGSLGSDMPDSTKAKMIRMTTDCARLLRTSNIWDAETKKQFGLTLYSLPEVKLLPQDIKAEYIDCIVFKVTAKFPDGWETDSAKTL